MARSKQEWGDTQIEVIIGNLLRVGVTLSAALVFVGGILYLYKYGAVRPHYRIFRGEPEAIRNIPAVVRFALAEHSRGIIQAGLLLLIATPVARVVFSVYAFTREHDWLYVGVTLLVLAILLYSLVWGKV